MAARPAEEAPVLADLDPIPTLAVKDLDRARQFYEGVLGFTPEGDAAEGVVYRAGSGRLLVYPSSYAGTNKATAMSFQVPAASFDDEVAELRGKVTFSTFDMDGITWDDGVATFGGERAVWFEDPDGNILNLESQA
jgi:catechol 2,3-dioxygenase-like lactoylglutathione lyase family enzyme